jgi:UDP-2,3-diacylglucosamine pyrophosphatase LpxH
LPKKVEIVDLNYRSLWLSDVQLGTLSSRAEELMQFLVAVRAERIYLVGDIVDLKRMRSRPRFPDLHMRVVAEFARLAARGTEVIFIPGNHDHEFRALAGRQLAGIPVAIETVHERPNGERLLVTHGDLLDGRIRHGANLEKFGAAAYVFLTEADVFLNKWRRILGRDYRSVSAGIKARLKAAQEYIHRFERVAAEYARERGFDGIVCGHIHRPNLRRIDGCLYANDGDWVEHGTALAESADGSLQILRWQAGSIQVEHAEDTRTLAA